MRARRHRGTRSVIAALMVVIFSGMPLAAQEAEKTVVILGKDVALTDGLFAVRKTGTVRAKPTTKGKKLGLLRKNDPVQVLGKAVGTGWYAVARDDEPWGFVYGDALIPVLDGTLHRPLSGSVTGLKAQCRYFVSFAGRNEANGDAIQSADYDLTLRCDAVGPRRLFRGFMFLIEMPYDLSRRPVYQINVDLIDMDDGQEPPSAVILFDRRTNKLRLDGVYPKHWAHKPAITERDARTVEEALRGSVSLAISAWNEDVWAALKAP